MNATSSRVREGPGNRLAVRPFVVSGSGPFCLIACLGAFGLIACSSGEASPASSGSANGPGSPGSGVSGSTANGNASGASSNGTGASAGPTNPNATGGLASPDATDGPASPDAMAASGATSAADGGGSPGLPPVDAGQIPSFVDAGACPPNAFLCDGFEEYRPVMPVINGQLDLSQMLPNWQQFHFHGFPRADNTVVTPYAGMKAAEFDTEASSYRFAAFIREPGNGAPAVPLSHFGRVWVQLKGVPRTAQWTILEVQGPLPNTPDEVTFGFGGFKGHLAASYARRKRITGSDGGLTLRPGAPQSVAEGNAITNLECTKTAATETFTTGKWVCLEWNIDAGKGVMHFWLDGVAQTEIDVDGVGTECTVGMPSAAWEGPPVLDKLNLVWESYNGGDSPNGFGGFDEFAIGTGRIGCQ